MAFAAWYFIAATPDRPVVAGISEMQLRAMLAQPGALLAVARAFLGH
jgi:hypothetical protein